MIAPSPSCAIAPISGRKRMVPNPADFNDGSAFFAKVPTKYGILITEPAVASD